MQQTPNYGLKKPENTDVVNIEDINDNADVLDAQLKTIETEVAATKKSVSDGKSLIAAAITLKKVATAATDTFAKMADNISKIISGSGNAQPSDVLAPKTFTNSTGVEQTGTIPSRGVSTITPGKTNQTIAAGQYLSGVQTIASLGGNVTAGDVLSGKTFSSDAAGRAVAGTMPNNTTRTSNGNVPGVNSNFPNNPVREGSPLQATVNTDGVYRIIISPARGYYHGGGGDYVGRPMAELGNASRAHVLAGRTFSSIDGLGTAGAMVNRGSITPAVNVVLSNGALYVRMNQGAYLTNATAGYPETSIPQASVAGAIGLTAPKLAKGQTVLGLAGTYTSDANATAGNILSGRTAYVNGSKVTGTIASQGGQTITPSRSQQVVSSANKYLTGNIVINPIPGDYWSANEQQTVFNYGSFGPASALGAYYCEFNGDYIIFWRVINAIRTTETGAISLTSNAHEHAFIFRGSLPVSLRYIRITARGYRATSQGQNVIQMYVVDPATKRYAYAVSYKLPNTGVTVHSGDLQYGFSVLPDTWNGKTYCLAGSMAQSANIYGVYKIELSPRPF